MDFLSLCSKEILQFLLYRMAVEDRPNTRALKPGGLTGGIEQLLMLTALTAGC